MAFRAETESITERCLRRAFDDAPVAQAMVSARPEDRGQFVDVNPQLAALLDRTPAELLGRSLAEFLNQRDRAAYDGLLRRLLTTHETSAQEFELDVTGPARVVAIITREAAEELDLKPGRAATAIVKSTSVMVER